ncbi:MAG TPA: type II secretion system protein [Clostridiales bacterium]|nr:type II secretion system protein [Clostridiales bacterium]
MIINFKKLQNRKGFTLIELIVVIAILSILAGIAVPKLTGFTDKAKKISDEQFSEVLKKTILIELLSGEIKIVNEKENGTIIISNDNHGLRYTTNNIEPADVKPIIESMIDNPKASLQYYDKVTLTIDKDTQEIHASLE